MPCRDASTRLDDALERCCPAHGPGSMTRGRGPTESGALADGLGGTADNVGRGGELRARPRSNRGRGSSQRDQAPRPTLGRGPAVGDRERHGRPRRSLVEPAGAVRALARCHSQGTCMEPRSSRAARSAPGPDATGRRRSPRSQPRRPIGPCGIERASNSPDEYDEDAIRTARPSTVRRASPASLPYCSAPLRRAVGGLRPPTGSTSVRRRTTSRRRGGAPGARGRRAPSRRSRPCRRSARRVRRRASQSIARWGVTTTTTSPSRAARRASTPARPRRRRPGRSARAGRGTSTSRAALGEPGDDLGRGRVPRVADVRLEGDAEDADLRALSARPRSLSASATRSTTWRGIARLMSPASSMKRSTKSNSRARQDEVVRIDRDAVAADAGARREAHEPERLGRRGVDDLPDVEAHPLAQQGELVDEGDVDVAEDVLEELRQLGRVGRGQLDDAGR